MQTEVARLFNISRMTVSKLMRPDSKSYAMYLEHCRPSASTRSSHVAEWRPNADSTGCETRCSSPIWGQILSPWMAVANCRPKGLHGIVRCSILHRSQEGTVTAETTS